MDRCGNKPLKKEGKGTIEREAVRGVRNGEWGQCTALPLKGAELEQRGTYDWAGGWGKGKKGS